MRQDKLVVHKPFQPQPQPVIMFTSNTQRSPKLTLFSPTTTRAAAKMNEGIGKEVGEEQAKRPSGDNDLTLSLSVSSISRPEQGKPSTMVNCRPAGLSGRQIKAVGGEAHSRRVGRLCAGELVATTSLNHNNNAKRRPPSQKLARQLAPSSLFFGRSLIFQLMLCYIVTRSCWPTASSFVEGMSTLPPVFASQSSESTRLEGLLSSPKRDI